VVLLLAARGAGAAQRPAGAHDTVRELEGHGVAVVGVLVVGQPVDLGEADHDVLPGLRCAPTGTNRTKTKWKMNEYKDVVADPPVGPDAPAPLTLRVCIYHARIPWYLVITSRTALARLNSTVQYYES
jgi:hypothetical protein